MSVRFSRIQRLADIEKDAGSTWVGFASVDHRLEHWSASVELRTMYDQLSEANRRRSDRYRSATRQTQFLLARLLVLHLLKNGPGLSVDGVEVTQLNSGQPVLCRSNEPMDLRVSISHSGNVAAVALSTGRVSPGIDIELEERLNISAMRFMLGKDRMAGSENSASHYEKDTERELRTEWLRRESAWKALGGPAELSVLTIQPESGEPYRAMMPISSIGEKRPIFTLMSSVEIQGDADGAALSFSANEKSFVACVCLIRD
jgi:phosphopantetheinyl transferase